MKIKRKTFKFKNTFGAILICEHCGHEMKITTGENTSNFNSVKLPGMICSSCHKDRWGKETKRFFKGSQSPG